MMIHSLTSNQATGTIVAWKSLRLIQIRLHKDGYCMEKKQTFTFQPFIFLNFAEQDTTIAKKVLSEVALISFRTSKNFKNYLVREKNANYRRKNLGNVLLWNDQM